MGLRHRNRCGPRNAATTRREQTDFARLEAPVFAWNPASMRVLQKVGFERESLRRRSVFKDGKLIDSALYVYLIDRPDRPAA